MKDFPMEILTHLLESAASLRAEVKALCASNEQVYEVCKIYAEQTFKLMDQVATLEKEVRDRRAVPAPGTPSQNLPN